MEWGRKPAKSVVKRASTRIIAAVTIVGLSLGVSANAADNDDLLLMLVPILAAVNKTPQPPPEPAGELTVEQTSTRLTVSSDKAPTWKVTFAIGGGAPGGGTAIGVHVPADASSVVQEQPNTTCCSGLGLDNLEWRYRDFGGTNGTRAAMGLTSSVSSFNIVENTPKKLVFQLQGSWPGVSSFTRTTTVTPDGFNTTVTANYSGTTGKDSMWWVSALFHNSKMSGGSVTIQDADTGPVAFPFTNGGRDIPSGIDLPYRINYPLTGTPNVAKLDVRHIGEGHGGNHRMYEFFNSGPPVGNYYLVYPRWTGVFQNTAYLFEWEWKFTPDD